MICDTVTDSNDKAPINHDLLKESRASLACLYRISGRFYMLQLISVYCSQGQGQEGQESRATLACLYRTLG